MVNEKKVMYKNIAIILFFTLISKGIVFIRETQMAGTYGANDITDAYNMSTQITTMISEIFAVAITSCFIPLLGKLYGKSNGDINEKRYLNQLTSLVMLSILGIAIGVFIIAEFNRPGIVRILSPGFSGSRRDFAISFSSITLITMLFMPMICIFNAFLNLQERFLTSSLATLILNLPPVLYLFFGNDIYGFIYCTVLGYVVQTVYLLICVIRSGFRFTWYINFRDEHFKQFLKLLGPVLLGLGATEINTLVDRIMASTLSSGQLLLYNYASKLENMIHLILSTCFINVMFVAVSKMKPRSDEFKNTSRETSSNMLLIVIPVSALIISLSDFVINFIYERGNFTANDTRVCSGVLSILAFGITIFAFRDLLNRIYYAANDTKTPTISSIAAILVNVIGNIILVRLIGINGLAISTIMSAALACIFLLFRSREICNPLFNLSFFIDIAKMVLSALIMSFTLMTVKQFVAFSQLSIIIKAFVLLALCGIGIVEYVFIAFVLKTKAVVSIYGVITKKLLKK